MADKILAGYRTVGTFAPIQLYAGEKQPVTTQHVAAAGHIFGALNERDETYLFAVVAEVGGKLVPWNPLGDGDVPAGFASGTVTLSTAVPADGDKITLGGHDIIFRAVADDANEVAIGATLALTAANLAAYINANHDAFGAVAVGATAAAAVVTIRAPGAAGNAVTLAKTFATGANGTVSGATLTGGTDDDAEAGAVSLPVGILPHALDTTATGYNADVDTPVFLEGVFNFEALLLPAGTSYQEVRQAFRRSGITIQKLY